MAAKRIVIVGGVAGGASCAARARRLSEDADIVLLERGPDVSFANCGLPYHIGGEITERSKLLVRTPKGLARLLNIRVYTNTEAVSIDREKREVLVREGGGMAEERLPYDALVLSTGAAPLRPPIPGIDREGLFTLRNMVDMDAIIAWVKRVNAQRAVVVGGGYIGLEMVEQFHRLGLKIAMAEAMDQVMGPLDPEMAAIIEAELKANDVEVHTGDGVAFFDEPITGESAAAATVVLKSGARLPADVVILAMGVKPEVGLARSAGLEIGKLGGVRVDDQLRTSDPCIYAIGDMVEVRDQVLGEWALIPLAGPANRQGRIVADVIFGLESRYRGTIGTAVARVFRQTAACTGANEKRLKRAGVPYRAIHLHPNSHAGYYPGAKPIAMKLLFAPDTRKVLGAQAVGEDGAEKRIDVIATAILGGMTIDDLAQVELCYAPPFGSAKDPVNLAGMVAENVLGGLVEMAQWNEVEHLDPNRTTVLDVRDQPERDRGAIEGSVHIPLAELRGRLAELHKNREYVVHCASGQRSYSAVRILRQNGFRARNLSGSYKTWAATKRG